MSDEKSKVQKKEQDITSRSEGEHSAFLSKFEPPSSNPGGETIEIPLHRIALVDQVAGREYRSIEEHTRRVQEDYNALSLIEKRTPLEERLLEECKKAMSILAYKKNNTLSTNSDQINSSSVFASTSGQIFPPPQDSKKISMHDELISACSPDTDDADHSDESEHRDTMKKGCIIL